MILSLAGLYVHDIDPVLLQIGGVCIWWYGLGFALGFLEIHLFLKGRRHTLHLSQRDVYSLSLYMVVGILVGGRALEIAFDEWPFYREHVQLIPAYWLGGMATHGLMLGGLIGAGLFAFRYEKSFLHLADALVVPAAFLMGMGRIGNFIDGQIVGGLTDVPWAVKFPDAEGYRHPVVLYDGAKNLVLVAYLLYTRRVNPTPGATAARFVFWYAFPRFFIDLFRDYPTHRLALGTGQTLNIVMSVIGGVLLYRSHLRRRGLLKSGLGPVVSLPRSLSARPLLSQQVAFGSLLVFCLTIPSNWTQDIPSRYGERHPGLQHSWWYPAIETAPSSPVVAQATPPSVVREPRSGTPFPVSVIPPGGTTPHWIMGTGLRARTIFRVQIYAFGLYVDPVGARAALSEFSAVPKSALDRDQGFYNRLLDLDFAMTLRLVLTRSVDGADIAEAFDSALSSRITGAQWEEDGSAATLEQFRRFFDVDEVKAGTSVLFSCGPDGRLTTSVGGRARPAIESRALCRALFDVYLGGDPISKESKRRVVAGFPALLLDDGEQGSPPHR